MSHAEKEKTYSVFIVGERVPLVVQASGASAAASLAAKRKSQGSFLEDDGQMGVFLEVAVFAGEGAECLSGFCGVFAV